MPRTTQAKGREIQERILRWSPLALLIVWAPFLVVGIAGLYVGSPDGKYVVAARGGAGGSMIIACVMFWAAIQHYESKWRLPSVIGSGVITVFLFASLYFLNGIQIGDDEVSVGNLRYFEDALYYSIVTWTTLGYGDMAPVKEMRLVAALEAVLGYFYMGIMIALLIQRRKGNMAEGSDEQSP